MLMTILIIVINIVIFLLIRTNKLHVEELASSYLTVSVRKQYYRLLSAGFTQAQPMHLLCNMYALYNVGSIIEYYYGSILYLIIYLVIMLLAGGVSLISRHNGRDDYTSSIGASGAICGLIGIYFVKIFMIYGTSALGGILRSLLPMVIMSFMPGVDYRNHFYGFIIGGIIGFIL